MCGYLKIISVCVPKRISGFPAKKKYFNWSKMFVRKLHSGTALKLNNALPSLNNV